MYTIPIVWPAKASSVEAGKRIVSGRSAAFSGFIGRVRPAGRLRIFP